MDVKQLIAEVASRNGIRLDADDPAFCLVTLNQLVLEETVTNMAEEIRKAAKDFESAAERVQARAGVAFARSYKEAIVSVRSDVALGKDSGRAAERRLSMKWAAIGGLSSVLIFGAGLLIGWAFL